MPSSATTDDTRFPPPGLPPPGTGRAASTGRRRWWLVAVVALVVVAVGVWGATGTGRGASGSGPAGVVSSTPADGEDLPVSPATVGITFPTEVTAGPGGVTVVDGDGRRVDQGVTTRPAPNQLRVTLVRDLPDGTYRVDYRVLDPAGDVLTGHTAFGVGGPPDPSVVAAVAPPSRPLVGAWVLLAAVALLGGTLVAIGLAAFAVLVAPAGDAQRRVRPWVRGAVAVGVLGAAATVVGRAAEATGEGLGAVTRAGVLGEVLRQGGTGWWLVGLVIGLAVVYAGIGLAAGPVRQALVVYGALLAAGSFALAGHLSVTSSVLSGVGDAVHVAVGALWTGGVVGLGLLVRWGDPDGAAAARRFAPVAAGSMVVLWVGGAAQSFAVLGSPAAVTDSAWGTTLAIKAGVAVGVVAVAVWGWRVLGRSPERLGRVLTTQAALLVVVVVLSSLLVTTVPDPTAGTGPQPTSQTLPVTGDVEGNLLVTPGTTGLNEIHVTYLDDTGALTDRIESVTVELALPFDGIGPIVVGGTEIEPGHYLIITENLTVAGLWRIDVVSRIGTNEQRRTTFEVPIGD